LLLSNILFQISKTILDISFKNKKIKNICLNSNDIKKGDLFISLKGKKYRGNNYLKQAISKGSEAIITDTKIKKIKRKIPIIYYKDIKNKLPSLLNYFYKVLPNNIAGVTGTNGKTSVCWYLSQILEINNINVSYLGTLGEYYNGRKISNLNNTTPDICLLHKIAFEHCKKGSNNFIFEASSHGLDQGRLAGLPMNIAAITNISQDHLDYHKNMKSYRKAKLKILTNYLEEKGTAIINSKIHIPEKIKKILYNKSIKLIKFGSKKDKLYIIKKNKKFLLFINSKKYTLSLNLLNEYDIRNLECSICIALAMGIREKYIIKNVSNILRPPGRMEKCNKLYNNSEVFVDFAHTPDALKNVLISTYKSLGKKPNLVFGCGGDRDKSKRVIMGKIANAYSQNTYITDDNPRNENPEKIRLEISKGCPNAQIIGDRKKAIKIAISKLKQKEVLIIAGKGHEKYQAIKKNKILFDDVKIVNKFIKDMNKKNAKTI
tara:strand:+ start:1490 stop:2956 length:1467 start_codon:yes stop_codon:yes gene_type:complete